MITRLVLSLLLSVCVAVPSLAADGKPVSYKSGEDTVSGMLYAPSGNGPFPALIVIHEFLGLNDWVKEQASKLADQGYVTLAIDLYRGKVADNPELGHELMRGLPQDRANRDLQSAFNYLSSQANVKKDRIGSIGWCMGGGYARRGAPRAKVGRDGHQLWPSRYGSRAIEKDQRADPGTVWWARPGNHAG